MAAIKIVTFSVLAPHPSSSSKLITSFPTRTLSILKTHNYPLKIHQTTRTNHVLPFVLSCTSGTDTATVEEATTDAASEEKVTEDKSQTAGQKRKLYIANLPWSLSVVDIENLFSQCGTVTDIEIIKQKSGKSRGFVFVTMGSPQEAQDCIDNFDTYEVSGRIIRVQFAKRLKRPPPPTPEGNLPANKESPHKIYVSNLAWKVRSTHLRDFFSANFKPVSSRVVFETPAGRSAGYGFVSFATREEAEAALAALNGQELMGRPLRLKFSEPNTKESGSEKKEEENAQEANAEAQTEE